MPGHGSMGSTGASVPNAITAPVAVEGGEREGRASRRASPHKRRAFCDVRAEVDGLHRRGDPERARTAGRRSASTSWACSTRGHERRRADGRRQRVERAPGPRRRRCRGSASRSRATPPARPARAAARAWHEPHAEAVVRRRGSPATGSIGSSRAAVREPSEPSANVLSQPSRSRSSGSGPERLAAAQPRAAGGVELLRADAGVDAAAPSSPAAASVAVGLERPAEVRRGTDAARVVDGDDAEREQLGGERARARRRSAAAAGRGTRSTTRPRRGLVQDARRPAGRRLAGSRPPRGIGAIARRRRPRPAPRGSRPARGGRGPRARPAGPAPARSRSSAVGHRPSSVRVPPAPSIHAVVAGRRAPPRGPGRRARRSTRSPRASTRAAPARRRPGAGAHRSAPGSRPRRRARSRRRVPAPARPRRRRAARRRPRGPLAIAIASTHPGPSAPASVAILPTTTRSAPRGHPASTGSGGSLVVGGGRRAIAARRRHRPTAEPLPSSSADSAGPPARVLDPGGHRDGDGSSG